MRRVGTRGRPAEPAGRAGSSRSTNGDVRAMDGQRREDEPDMMLPGPNRSPRRWFAHGGHAPLPAPVRLSWVRRPRSGRPGGRSPVSSPVEPSGSEAPVVIDGSRGEGGGQILRTALTLSLLTGRAFRMTRIRANRERPGLRPQHLKAVEAAALLGGEVRGAEVGSRELAFRPRPYAPRDLKLDIGTAGSAALVLQTLHLPLAMRAE